MATQAIRKPMGSGESHYVVYIRSSTTGSLLAKVEIFKDAIDAAPAQDATDLTVHISSTLQGLTYYTDTTIS